MDQVAEEVVVEEDVAEVDTGVVEVVESLVVVLEVLVLGVDTRKQLIVVLMRATITVVITVIQDMEMATRDMEAMLAMEVDMVATILWGSTARRLLGMGQTGVVAEGGVVVVAAAVIVPTKEVEQSKQNAY